MHEGCVSDTLRSVFCAFSYVLLTTMYEKGCHPYSCFTVEAFQYLEQLS